MAKSRPRQSSATIGDECPVLNVLGDEVKVLLNGSQTGGAISMMEIVSPPGGGPPPHWHTREDEWFYVLEGRAEFWENGSWQEVPPGSAVYMPRATRHTYRNCGDTPLRLLVQTTPAGFDHFLEKLAAEGRSRRGPDMKRIVQISADHGIFFVEP